MMLRVHRIRDVLRTGSPGGEAVGPTPGQAVDDEGEKNVWLGTDQLHTYYPIHIGRAWSGMSPTMMVSIS